MAAKRYSYVHKRERRLNTADFLMGIIYRGGRVPYTIRIDVYSIERRRRKSRELQCTQTPQAAIRNHLWLVIISPCFDPRFASSAVTRHGPVHILVSIVYTTSSSILAVGKNSCCKVQKYIIFTLHIKLIQV